MNELLSELGSGPILIVLALLCTTVVVVGLASPHVAFAVALACLYNPYFSFRYALSESFEGAGVRALFSLALLASLGFALFLRHSIHPHSDTRVRTFLDRPLMFFSGLMVISAIHALFAGHDLRLILADLMPLLEFLGFFIIGAKVLRTPRQAMTFSTIILVLGTFTASILLVLYVLLGSTLTTDFLVGGTGIAVQRLTDFMPIVLLPFALGMAIHAGTAKRLWLSMCIGILSATLIVGFWRSAWLAVVFALSFIVWSLSWDHQRSQRPTSIAVVVVVLGSVIFVVLPRLGLPIDPAEAVFARASSTRSTDSSARLSEIRDLSIVIANKPILGTGFGATTVMTSTLPPYADTLRHTGTVHNYYFALASQVGLLALLLFLWVPLRIFLVAKSALRQNLPGPQAGLLVGAVASFLAVGVAIAFNPIHLHFSLFAYLGALAALVTVLHHQHDELTSSLDQLGESKTTHPEGSRTP